MLGHTAFLMTTSDSYFFLIQRSYERHQEQRQRLRILDCAKSKAFRRTSTCASRGALDRTHSVKRSCIVRSKFAPTPRRALGRTRRRAMRKTRRTLLPPRRHCSLGQIFPEMSPLPSFQVSAWPVFGTMATEAHADFVSDQAAA